MLGLTSIVACGDAVQPDPNAITVTGTVVNEYLQPQPGVGVVVTGHDMVIADAAGHFSVTGVTPPYVLTTSFTADRAAMVYAGLTRTDPLVVVPASSFVDPTYGAHVGGTVQGVDALLPWHHLSVWFESPETGQMASLQHAVYSAGLRWNGVPSTTGAVYALQWQLDSTTLLPSSYTAYGSRAIALSNGGSLGGQDVATGPVETQSVRGTVTVPDGYAISRKRLLAAFAAPPSLARGWVLLTDTSTAGTFDYAAPTMPGATLALSVEATDGVASATVLKTGPGAAAEATLDLPQAPSLIAPADGATQVGGDVRFSWSRMPGAVYLLSIITRETVYMPPPVNFYVFTTDTTATLPDVSALGLWSYPGARYVWNVYAWAPFEHVDDILVPTWFVPQGDARMAVSAARSFSVR